MKTLFLSLILLYGVLLTAASQPTFQKVFGGSGIDWFKQASLTSDSGCILTGMYLNDLLLVRTNQMGDTLWTAVYGDTMQNEGYSVRQTMDGGFVATGITHYAASNGILVLKTNASGALMWLKSFHSSGVDNIGYSILQMSDSGFMVTGTTGYTVGNSDIVLMRLNSTGDIIWSNSYSGPAFMIGYSTIQTVDGSFVITGKAQISLNNYDIFLLKVDPSGNVVWSYTYGGSDIDYGSDVIETSNGNLAVAATISNSSGSNLSLLETNPSGTPLITNVYGLIGDDISSAILQTLDGGFLLAGRADCSGSKDAYLIRTDSSGNTVWAKTYGDINSDRAYSIEHSPGGGYYICGESTSHYGGLGDASMIRTDASGNSGCHDSAISVPVILSSYPYTQSPFTSQPFVPVIYSPPLSFYRGIPTMDLCVNDGIFETPFINLEIFPNPVSENFIIRNGSGKFTLYNALGQNVLEGNVNGSEQMIDVLMFPTGAYYLKICDGNQVGSKIILIR